MIEGGSYGGAMRSSRKRHLREVNRQVYVNTTQSPTKGKEVCPITFTEEDEKGVMFPHEDAVVISAIISNMEVRRILIDSGSSVDVMFLEAYQKMGFGKKFDLPARHQPRRIRRKCDTTLGRNSTPHLHKKRT
ncbi:UNVERIFIED_CONTAM: hypothetical protein Slati_2166800 [Sesamum latifolium]|uniref:Gag-pol polyprotein n=1 Tax=Sesamum latifolium TaxID=2727402 RepID=A0AAW2WT52_9LAMI